MHVCVYRCVYAHTEEEALIREQFPRGKYIEDRNCTNLAHCAERKIIFQQKATLRQDKTLRQRWEPLSASSPPLDWILRGS